MDAAIKVFYEKGYSASSLQDVADIVGVLKGSLYHYISSKEDLLFRILQESHEHARVIMHEVAERDGQAADRLRAFLERMYMWYLDHIERVSLYFNQQQHLTGDNKAEMLVLAREFEQFVRDLLTEARDEGTLRPDLDIKLAAFFVLGALNSIPMWYKASGPYPSEHIADEFAEMSMGALLPRAGVVAVSEPEKLPVAAQ
ncbi:MAG: TetR/AcrR family transcriptional regulator [Actinokineospora sp.]